jgi:hypothetical protein
MGRPVMTNVRSVQLTRSYQMVTGATDEDRKLYDYGKLSTSRAVKTIKRSNDEERAMSDTINKTNIDSTPMEKTMTSNDTTTVLARGETKMRFEKDAVKDLMRVLHQAGVHGITMRQWRAIRKVPGEQIDPFTAEIMWVYSDRLEYGMGTLGVPCREYFARARNEQWVRFCDLPDDILRALRKKHGLSPIVG